MIEALSKVLGEVNNNKTLLASYIRKPMSVVTAIYEAIKDPLMKEVTRLKDEIEDSLLDLKEAFLSLQSSSPEVQKEGLQRIKEQVAELIESELWKLMTKSRMASAHRMQTMVRSFQEGLLELEASFDDEEKREGLIKRLRLKIERMLSFLPRLGIGKNSFVNGWIIKGLTVVVPATAIYFLGQNVMKNNHFISQDVISIAPDAHFKHKKEEQIFTLKEHLKDELVEDLEKSYFADGWSCPENNIDEIFKVTMVNSSGHFPLMLSTLGIEVKYEALPFEWNRLNVVPKTKLKEETTDLILTIDSGPPALNVHVQSTLGLDTTLGILHKAPIDLDAFGNITFWRLDEDSNTFSDGPLYYQLPQDSTDTQSANLEKRDGLIEIHTVSDLETFVKGKRVSEYSVTMAYEDLHGKNYQKEEHYDIDGVFYIHPCNDKLLDNDQDPSCPMKIHNVGDGFSGDPKKIQGKLLTILGHSPEVHPNGLMLYKDSLTLNLEKLTNSDTLARYKYIDVVMNPEGLVTLLVRLKKAQKNGLYHVSVVANDTLVEQFKFEVFKPTEHLFSYPKSVELFKAAQEKHVLSKRQDSLAKSNK